MWYDVVSNNVLHYFFLGYGISLMLSYGFIATLSLLQLKWYKNKKNEFDSLELISSELSPKVAVIAPAFNEGFTIVENVRSLLSLNYPNLEIIVVDDGSTDGSLELLKKAYQLEKYSHDYYEKIPTQEINGVYKSTNKAQYKLIVISKNNGGKGDALNAGINISESEFITCIDVDSLLTQNAITKLVQPFLEHPPGEILAVGSAIRVANNCTVLNGEITDVRVPKNLWAKFQALEYLRSFLLGRMGWSRINGVLLVSGAVGLYDKQTIVNAGGYSCETVGEDFELTVRIRILQYEQKKKNKIIYLPDPICWTQVPTSPKALGKQRNRWTRGSIETLWKHRKVLFNPHYGIMGILSFPFWFLFEWMAPLVEFTGLVYFRLLVVHQQIIWTNFLILLVSMYLFSVIFSLVAIIEEEMSFRRYNRRTDALQLILVAFIEPLLYHPILTINALKGNIQYLISSKKKRRWGVVKKKKFI